MNHPVVLNPLRPYYPQEPNREECCEVNTIYQSLPPSSPNYPTYWRTTAAGPSSIKHIYPDRPNWYPFMKISQPVGTLYEHDYSQFHETGVGQGKRISYQYKPYPLTDQNVRETHNYADYILPPIDTRQLQKHPVRRDASVNSPLQYHPNPYTPIINKSD